MIDSAGAMIISKRWGIGGVGPRTVCLALFLGQLPFIIVAPVVADGLDDFAPFLDQTWVGHFVDSPDSNLTHILRWESILDGKAIRKTKEVPEVDFRMEAMIYVDAESGDLAYLSVNSKGGVARGTFTVEDGVLVQHGTQRHAAGTIATKYTFEILADGRLEDLFLHEIPGSWRQGHKIHYRAQVGER